MGLRIFLALACTPIVATYLSAQEVLPQPRLDPPQQGAAGQPAPPAVLSASPPLAPPPTTPFGSGFAQQPATPFGSGFAEPLPDVFVMREPMADPTFWLGFEGLLWWTRNQPLSLPVVTTGPASQGEAAGNLGALGTVSITAPLRYDPTGGLRMFAGGWFDDAHTIGMDGSFFLLGRQSTGFSVVDRSGLGSMVINMPLAGPMPGNTQVSAPGVATGGVVVDAASRFGGADIDVAWNLYRADGWTVNLLAGYRFLRLEESLTFTANSRLFTTMNYIDRDGDVLVTAPPGSTIVVRDRFGTRNDFNGGQLGASFEYLRNRWSIAATAKVAIGSTQETITVEGATRVAPGHRPPVVLGGGNFATVQQGCYSSNHFAVAPEGQFNVGYQFTPWLRGQVGYTFLYLSHVARPGNQIDTLHDGVVRPTVPLTSSGFWGQGLNFTLQYRF